MRLFLLISLTLSSTQAFAWGSRGHELIAELGNSLISSQAFSKCHVTSNQIIEHSTDPDMKWRQDRRRHPDEAVAHFFHVDKQPMNWKNRTDPEDRKQGFLVYRIIKWADEAKKLRSAEEWDQLNEKLYGLVHYLGDLTQPLHLTYKHDGKEVGLPGLHKQWETKMVSRYENEIRTSIIKSLSQERIPPLWTTLDFKSLIFNISEQSQSKSEKLFNGARQSILEPRSHKKRRTKNNNPRFSKPLLFFHTGSLAVDQMALSSRLWAFTFNLICN